MTGLYLLALIAGLTTHEVVAASTCDAYARSFAGERAFLDAAEPDEPGALEPGHVVVSYYSPARILAFTAVLDTADGLITASVTHGGQKSSKVATLDLESLKRIRQALSVSGTWRPPINSEYRHFQVRYDKMPFSWIDHHTPQGVMGTCNRGLAERAQRLFGKVRDPSRYRDWTPYFAVLEPVLESILGYVPTMDDEREQARARESQCRCNCQAK